MTYFIIMLIINIWGLTIFVGEYNFSIFDDSQISFKKHGTRKKQSYYSWISQDEREKYTVYKGTRRVHVISEATGALPAEPQI